MFSGITPPVLANERDRVVHPALLRLTAEVPEGWAVLKPPQGIHAAMWLLGPGAQTEDQQFRANLLVQSVPMLDDDATDRTADAFVEDVESGPTVRVRTARNTVDDHGGARVDHLAVQWGDQDLSVIQNCFLVLIRSEDPTLVIVTASAEEGDEMSSHALKGLCESVIGELVHQLSPREEPGPDSG